MKKVLITTIPFGEIDPKPFRLLELAGWEYTINPLGRRLQENELAEMAVGYDGIIAGTEPITEKVIEASDRLKLIARVGIGLDNVDLLAARKKGIAVSYTPDAPAPAVAELTLGLMLNLLRLIQKADKSLHKGKWNRLQGRRLSECTIGLIGVGRIGSRIIKLLEPFQTQILANDLAPAEDLVSSQRVRWTSKEEIYRKADIVSFHVPLTPLTKNLVGEKEIAMMKKEALLINTARGGILNEAVLYTALKNKQIAGVAVDVFEEEPYQGKLAELENALLTCHMGSCTRDCRAQMEIEATEEIISFFKNNPLRNQAPEIEYELRDTEMHYLVHSEPNQNIHVVGGSDLSISDSQRYQDYRRQWHENPARFKVSDFPLHLDIETVSESNGETKFLSLDLASSIFEEAGKKKCCAVKLSHNGDPLRHIEIVTLVELARQAGLIDIYFQSAGELLTEDLSKKLIDAGLNRLSIDVSLLDEKDPGASQVVLANLQALKSIRIFLNRNNPKIRVQNTLESGDQEKIDRYTHLWRPYCDEVAYLNPQAKEALGDSKEEKIDWACPIPWQRLLIRHDGKVCFCEWSDTESTVGDLKKQSIAEIWNSKKMKALRNTHKRGLCHKDKICGDCLFRSSMMG